MANGDLFAFGRRETERIVDAVRRVERMPTSDFGRSLGASWSNDILRGVLDGSLTQNSTATVSIYDENWDDTDENIIGVESNNEIGYLYEGTKVWIVLNGDTWQILAPKGDLVQGKLDGALQQNSNATLSIFDNDWSTDTGDNVTVNSNTDIGYVYANTRCQAVRIKNDWRLVAPRGDIGFGQADGAIAQDSPGTVSIYNHQAGVWTDTTHNITARAINAIASGDRVAWQWEHDDEQFIAGCVG